MPGAQVMAVVLVMALALFGQTATAAETKAPTAVVKGAVHDTLPIDLRPRKGDWDDIVKRYTLRVLVVPSHTFYFVDKGRIRKSHDNTDR